jgi:hypothetical protein
LGLRNFLVGESRIGHGKSYGLVGLNLNLG